MNFHHEFLLAASCIRQMKEMGEDRWTNSEDSSLSACGFAVSSQRLHGLGVPSSQEYLPHHLLHRKWADPSARHLDLALPGPREIHLLHLRRGRLGGASPPSHRDRLRGLARPKTGSRSLRSAVPPGGLGVYGDIRGRDRGSGPRRIQDACDRLPNDLQFHSLVQQPGYARVRRRRVRVCFLAPSPPAPCGRQVVSKPRAKPPLEAGGVLAPRAWDRQIGGPALVKVI
jgi:hypothetical protein